MNIIFGYFLLALSIAMNANAQESWSFSLSFLDTIETEPYDQQLLAPDSEYIAEHYYQPAVQQSRHWSTAYSAINLGALIYAATTIYKHYLHHYVATPEPDNIDSGVKSTLSTWLLYITPGFVHNGTQHCKFLLDCCKTTLLTLLYKTIAKLVIACGQYDLVELLAQHDKRMPTLLQTFKNQNHVFVTHLTDCLSVRGEQT